MSTVILKWNPGFSSYTMIRFLKDLEKCTIGERDDVGMNWSVWDFDQVHEGDIFYMLKVGYGQTGIVARGTITSEPYAGEDWSWRGRPTKYCDFDYGLMINPDAYPLLDSKALTQAIPDFDWTGGHSGVVLNDSQATALETLWNEYMAHQAEYFDRASDHNLFVEMPQFDDDKLPYSFEIEGDYDGGYESATIELIFTKDGVRHILRIFNYERVLGKFGVKSWRALRLNFLTNYPTAESLQQLCADLFKCQIDFRADFRKADE
ncbi:MAG: hypothetical protein UH625_10180 [Muribaculaceae bacterium]|nr:hypothetical protein [Muribaculaceae bacterium]